MIVALVYPRLLSRNSGGLEEPLGLLYLASALRAQNHEVRFVDLTFAGDLSVLDEPIRGSDWIGVSATSSLLGRAREVASYIRAREPDVPLVIGGPHATALTADALAGGFDYAVVGEGEGSVLEFCDKLVVGRAHETRGIAFRRDGEVVRTPRFPFKADLDRIAMPAREDVDYRRYTTFGSIVTRGCPFRCTYCKPMQEHLFGSKIRSRSAENVVDEIEQLVELDPKRLIYFKDDVLTILSPGWFERFAEELERRGMRIRWQGNSRVDTVGRRKLELMRASGCVQLAFGVESGSQKVLDYYEKGTNVTQAEEAFDNCHKLGILPHAYIMLGAPVETREDLELTYQHIKTIKPKSWMVYTVTPFPGNKLYEDLVSGHHFVPSEDYELFDNAQNSVEGRMPIRCAHITVDDINEYRDKINRYLIRLNLFDPKVIMKAIGRPKEALNRLYDIFVHK